MKRYKWLVLGAGPAGLTFANKLVEAGESNLLVIEKEERAGGLCRSQEIDGSPLDIGGGHFLDITRPIVTGYLFKFMPENEWNLYERNSQIYINDRYISHPLEANIWQMDAKEQIEYIKSIAYAGCNMGKAVPDKFVDWISWKLGSKIANEYMLPYNRKMFTENLDDLGTYWMDKLPNVSLDDTLMSCIDKKAYGKQPGHAKFYYPKKYGYGELWLRMAKTISKYIIYNCRVVKLDFNKKQVTLDTNQVIGAENIVVTIPWNSIKYLDSMPETLVSKVRHLRHNSIEIKYIIEKIDTKAHWIYYPDSKYTYHRILVRHNFCPNSNGYWTETNTDNIKNYEPVNEFRYINEYAYPLNTIDKPIIMRELLSWTSLRHIYGLGRWGEHQHYNSDVTVLKAIELFNKIA
jgi:protoporphyrinogen oxidase